MIQYWNFTDIAEHTGLPSVSLRQRSWRGTMPEPDAQIGSMPGWLPATIETWWETKKEAESLLTVENVAALIGKSTSTLALWRSEGTGPKWRKIGNLVRYSRADVDTWMEAGE